MTSNFDFLKPDFPKLYDHATQAESLVYSAPRASCFYSRFTLEQAVLWLYQQDSSLQIPDDHSLGALIHERTFKDNLAPNIFPKISLIQKVGNIAVHQQTKIGESDSLHILKELFHFLYWLCRNYSAKGNTLNQQAFRGQLTKRKKSYVSATAKVWSLYVVKLLETWMSS